MAGIGLRIIFAGSGEFGVPTLRWLLGCVHQVVGVFTQPDRPAGRGRQLRPTPIAEAASRSGIPPTRTDNINLEPMPDADLMLVIAFGQKIAADKVNHPRLGSINLHASRLPRYRGAAPINWAILNGETITGNSVIRLAQKMDAGDVLAQSEIPIGDLETAGELHDRLAIDGVPLVQRVLEELTRGMAHQVPQDDSQATLAPKLSREDARLDFSRPAVELARRIRGLYPWPGCRVEICDAEGKSIERMRLVRARVADDDGPRWEAGEITSAGTVHTGHGTLDILECHPEGKVAMPMSDFRRGHRWQAGLRLRSID